MKISDAAKQLGRRGGLKTAQRGSAYYRAIAQKSHAARRANRRRPQAAPECDR